MTQKGRLKEWAWDLAARHGYDSASSQRYYHQIHAAVLDAGEAAGCKPRRLLDAGCGTGELLKEAARRYPRAKLSGIDFSPNMLEAARGKFKPEQADLQHGSAEHLPYADGSFDLVMSTASMHHWPDDLAGMREIGRVLEPGGVFLLSVPVWRGGWDRRGWSLVVSKWFDLVRRVYTEDELEHRLNKAEFALTWRSTMDMMGLRHTIWVLRPGAAKPDGSKRAASHV